LKDRHGPDSFRINRCNERRTALAVVADGLDPDELPAERKAPTGRTQNRYFILRIGHHKKKATALRRGLRHAPESAFADLQDQLCARDRRKSREK
jgi:hypothetical protein